MPRVIVPGGRRLKALNFSGTTDLVDHGSDASLEDLDPFGWFVAIKPTTLTAATRFMSKVAQPGSHQFLIDNVDTSRVHFRVKRGGTTAVAVGAAGTMVADIWQFFYGWFDSSASPAIKLYRGTLTSPPAEVSYDTQDSGTGATDSDATKPLIVGNQESADTVFPGSIAFATVFAAALSDAQIIDQWDSLHAVSSTRLLTRYGMDGPGIQVDRSGNGNHGTVTGATLVQGPPLTFRRGHRLWAVPTGGFPWPRHPAQAQSLIRF